MVGTSDDPAYIDVYKDRQGVQKKNVFNFCAPRATMPKKTTVAMKMAAKQATAVAEKAKKKKKMSPIPSDEEEITASKKKTSKSFSRRRCLFFC